MQTLFPVKPVSRINLFFNSKQKLCRKHGESVEMLWGINFRMPELLGTVMRVQPRRLDGLLSGNLGRLRDQGSRFMVVVYPRHTITRSGRRAPPRDPNTT